MGKKRFAAAMLSVILVAGCAGAEEVLWDETVAEETESVLGKRDEVGSGEGSELSWEELGFADGSSEWDGMGDGAEEALMATYDPFADDSGTADLFSIENAPVVSDGLLGDLAANSGTCGDTITWILDREGTLTISGTGKTEDYTMDEDAHASSAPWFHHADSIRAVVVEEGVTSIGFGAFYACRNLETVSFPGSLTEIGDGAFSNCISLDHVEIPDSVYLIGWGAFKGCSGLTAIHLPTELREISAGVLEDCVQLKSLTIPENVELIMWSSFSCCKSLTEITIPAKITEIMDNAFAECAGLTEVTIPSSVVKMGDGVFHDCTDLEKVYIPRETVDFGPYIFEDCDKVTVYGYGGSAIEKRTVYSSAL